MPSPNLNVGRNLEEIRERIAAACERGRRKPSEVCLIAVSKAQPIERIEAALEAGQRVFGENYVQESAGRWPRLREVYPDCEVHMIGPLQTNKAGQAVELFDCIQSVDRMKLARELSKACRKQERWPRFFCQINTGEEPQKAGVLPADADDFIADCRLELGMTFEGLMAIPPVAEDLASHAQLLETIAKRHEIKGVSIGMSADFEMACEFGATHVRVGSAIFGERAKK